VVTAEAGRLGTPALLSIQDAEAGIVIRLTDGSRPARGTWLEVTGVLADPYGQLEVRSLSSLRVIGTAALPASSAVDGFTLGEPVESRLVTLDGAVKVKPAKSTSGDFTFDVATARGVVRVAGDGSAGIVPTSISVGDRLRLTGVVGQHASRKGALDGYRVWLRDPADIIRATGPGASGSPSPTAGGSPGPSGSTAAPIISIADAIRARSGSVKVEGTVVADATLLDASGRRIVIEDRTAAIEVVLPASSSGPRVGARIRVTGEIGRAYGAPRIRATLATAITGGSPIAPIELRVAPGSAHEWRLVRVKGSIVDVRKIGDRWRAEIVVGGQRIPVTGLAGARIPVTAVIEGRTATIVGIVRRPYPSATDRRFAIVPRSRADIALGTAGSASSAPSVGTGASTSGGASSGTSAGQSSSGSTDSSPATPLDLDIAEIGDHVGVLVRVGGLVGGLQADGFELDDGTAVGRIVLRGAAVDQRSLIGTGDALNAIGIVEAGSDSAAGAHLVAVTDPAGIIRVGDPSADAPSTAPSEPAALPTGLAIGGDPATHRASGLLDSSLPDIGIAGVVLAGLASLAVTLLRRHRMRRQLAIRVARRLSTIAAASNGVSR
jgi:hypothetical protein